MRALLLLSFLLCSLTAQAQLYESTSQEVTAEEAQQLFTVLKQENSRMDKYSECFQRAHMWALRAERKHDIVMEKVFLFFTRKFSMRHRVTNWWPFSQPFTWWFHVAPAVRVDGELWVMDATFTESAMPLQEWAGSLMKTPELCVPLNNPQDYVVDRNTPLMTATDTDIPQCYYTTAPRFLYQPLELGFVDDGGMQYKEPAAPPTDWESFKLRWALEAYKGSSVRKTVRQELAI